MDILLDDMRELVQKYFDEVTDHMTWEQAKECAKIAVDYSATINGIRQERVDYLKENIDRI